MDKYIQTLDTRHIAPVCKNYAVDSLVRYYMGCAYNHQIEINVSLNVPENLYILESDLCIIIGNLLENALESCRQQKNSKGFIRFKMDIAGEKMLVISVINSYEGTIMKKVNILYPQSIMERGSRSFLSGTSRKNITVYVNLIMITTFLRHLYY